MTTEIILMWAAVTAYVVSTALFVLGVSFEKDALVRFGVWAAGAGLLLHAGALGVRWVRVGHGPMRGYYEMTSSLCFLAVFMFRKYALHDHTDTNYLFLRVVAYFHGFICIAFAVMVADIFRAMKWTKGFALTTLLGAP